MEGRSRGFSIVAIYKQGTNMLKYLFVCMCECVYVCVCEYVCVEKVCQREGITYA